MVDVANTREVAGQTILALGRECPNLVVVGGDLNKSTFTNLFAKEFPDRFFDFGPAEQNMVSVAAGLASSGKIPIISTFAVFATSRPYDQLRVGVSQSRLNVKIVATHSGLITGEDGVSAQSIEDIAIMSALPEFTVIVPADGPETAEAVRNAVETQGPFYIRVSRPATPIIHSEDFAFKVGKAERVREGNDVTVIACGIMVNAALEAAEELSSTNNVECRVLNMATLKPVDTQAIVSAARETGAIVTAEEHYLVGGLGSLVSQTAAVSEPVPIENVGMSGYAESGKPNELLEKYHLSPRDIVKAVRKVMDRKSAN